MNIYSLRLNTFISNDLHCRAVPKWEILKCCDIIEKMQLALLGELLNSMLVVWAKRAIIFHSIMLLLLR